MHPSLIDLGEQAPRCTDTPTLRGVLAESQDLLRNAFDHNEDPQDLVRWFSQLLTDALHSQAVTDLTGGAQLVLTGAVGRGDALPSSPITWLTVAPPTVDSANIDTTKLSQLIAQVGLVVEKTPLGSQALTRKQWRARIHSANATELALFTDAGTWCLEEVLQLPDATPLLIEALAHRPPSLKLNDSLPDRDVPVDIRKELLYPIIAIARWAGVTAQSHALATCDRLADATAAGVLNSDQADYLTQAWQAGLRLQFMRFTDRVHSHATTAESLPAIQRSLYGASARMVSDVAHSLATSHGIDL